VNALFVSLDPRRDKPEMLGRYAATSAQAAQRLPEVMRKLADPRIGTDYFREVSGNYKKAFYGCKAPCAYI
jgi:hypothetical protein